MAEFQLETLRPLDLPKVSHTPMSGLPPVPHDEWDGGSTPRPVQDSGKGKGQSSVISDGPKKSFEARSFESGSFKTPPSSWQHQSEGRMPSVEKGSGTRTEGPQPEIGEPAPSRPDLERALEEEMFMQLWKENKALKDELAACKKREHGETSSWSAISSTGQVGTPKRKSTDGGSFRYHLAHHRWMKLRRFHSLHHCHRFLMLKLVNTMSMCPRHVGVTVPWSLAKENGLLQVVVGELVENGLNGS